MKVLGHTEKHYLCEVSHSELEQFLDLYYDKLKKLKVGDEIDLGTGYKWHLKTATALKQTEDFFKAHRENIQAITKAFLGEVKND